MVRFGRLLLPAAFVVLAGCSGSGASTVTSTPVTTVAPVVVDTSVTSSEPPASSVPATSDPSASTVTSTTLEPVQSTVGPSGTVPQSPNEDPLTGATGVSFKSMPKPSYQPMTSMALPGGTFAFYDVDFTAFVAAQRDAFKADGYKLITDLVDDGAWVFSASKGSVRIDGGLVQCGKVVTVGEDTFEVCNLDAPFMEPYRSAKVRLHVNEPGA